MLCDSVFSLPQLENLKLVLGKGVANMLRNQRHGFEDEMYNSWNKKGGGVKLKSISLQTHTEKDIKKVKLIAHTVSFSSPKLSTHHREHYDFSDDEFEDHYFVDDYYDYNPWNYYDSDDS